MPPPGPGSSSTRLAPAVLIGLFAVLLAASWRRWADPIVDFGREPYVAWQLLEGRRDLASLFGPLSPWVNALWFRLFGVSLATLAGANLAIAAVLAVVVQRFGRACVDGLAATLATAVLLIAFVFAHGAVDAAGYDFVWPYTHAATHGTVLLVCGIVVLGRALVDDAPAAWAGAGVLLAATALTKPEITVAAGAASAVAVGWQAATRGRSAGPLLLGGAAVVTLAVAALAFGAGALAWPWTAIARVTASDRGFYATMAGATGLWGAALRVGLPAALWCALAAMLAVYDIRYAGAPAERQRRAVLVGVALAAMLAVPDLRGVGRALPILVPLAGAALAAVAWCRPAERARLVPLVVWSAAAAALLGKILLDVQFHRYGFYLTMPAALLVVWVGVGTVPSLLARRVPGGGWLVRPVAIATVAGLLAYSAALSAASWRQMTVPVGQGRDAMRAPDLEASPTGTLAEDLAARLEGLPAGATLAVLPDGALLNFLLRRPNPTPYHQLMPPELAAFGMDRVVAAYDAAPPDYVVLIAWPGDEYGVGAFGSPEWGAELVAWVTRRYGRLADVPGTAGRIGWAIWQRR